MLLKHNFGLSKCWLTTIFIAMWFIPFHAISQSHVIFDHLNAENGLSQNSVISIIQDQTGYMWFGTKYGLNRYDGCNFKIFKNGPEANSMSSSDFIRGLAVDDHHQLWVGSISGVDKFNPENQSFTHVLSKINTVTCLLSDSRGNFWVGSNSGLKYSNDKALHHFKTVDINTNASCQVVCIFEDHEQQIWVGTTVGLFKIVYRKGKFEIQKFRHKPDNKSISSDFITSIAEDHLGHLWIATKYDGINLYNKASGTFHHFKYIRNGENSLVNNSVRKILCAKDGNLWVGTQDGLSIIDPLTLKCLNYQHDAADPSSLSQNSIYNIFQDRFGSIWIGTYFGGVDIVHSISTPFTVYQNNKYINSISSNVISDILEDELHNLWIGTEAGGLNYFDRKRGEFFTYKHDPEQEGSLSSNLVKTVYIDRSKRIWVGTSFGGLNLFDASKKRFIHFTHRDNDPASISSDDVNCLLEDDNGNLLVGTGLGINMYNPQTGRFTVINYNNQGNGDQIINTIYEDKSHNIWVGTKYSLKLISGVNQSIKTFVASHSCGLLSSNINCFHQDSQGHLWVGTYHGGLSEFNAKTLTFKAYTEKDGLPSNNIIGILEDQSGSLWLSTDNGISKFNPITHRSINYNKLDGLPGNVFNNSSYLKDHEGRLFFGGYNGMISFKPEKIEINLNSPKTVFSNLYLNRNVVQINGKDGLLTNDINYTKCVNFQYNQNIFTIAFAALNFIKPDKNIYAYKLENFEKNWNYTGTPSASYSNLPAGQYRFLVKSANNDGVWGTQPATLLINILPPLWRTWWAYCIYVTITLTITILVAKFFRDKAKLKRDYVLEHREAEHQEKLFQMKLNFFTNVSHEIRTPLTLIMGPLEKVLNNTRDMTDVQQSLLTVKTNTDRLYRLVTELLDFRKAESGNFKLYMFQDNIVNYIEEIFLSFRSLAESRGIEYLFLTNNDEALVYFDKDQLEKVFFNLLSNAFKFTHDGGQIKLSINCNDEGSVKISITDNGKGIPDDSFKKVFENFYQVSTTSGYSIGTGIGLALTKSIVELHGGAVEVESRGATDTCPGYTMFTVSLKMGIDHLDSENLLLNKSVVHKFDEYHIQNYIADAVQPDNIQIPQVEKSGTLLLVEDNDDVREFIRQSLSGIYNIDVCANGKDGWDKAVETIPDLVISDVMMPVMDGLELCRKLKTDDRTCHIPVILLTARSAYIHQINGLQNGADAYITKPFSDQLLQLTIQNLLTLKVALQKKYSSQLFSELPVINTSSNNDEKLLQRLYDVIDRNISNSEFGLAELTSEIGMSKSVLYKKFSALTNLSLTDFIKTHRLKRAATLLQQGEFSVSEIAFMVGFADPKYFSKEFSKVFGQSPSKYLTANALH